MNDLWQSLMSSTELMLNSACFTSISTILVCILWTATFRGDRGHVSRLLLWIFSITWRCTSLTRSSPLRPSGGDQMKLFTSVIFRFQSTFWIFFTKLNILKFRIIIFFNFLVYCLNSALVVHLQLFLRWGFSFFYHSIKIGCSYEFIFQSQTGLLNFNFF